MIKEAISQLVGGHSLTMDESSNVMDEIMEGIATPAQFGAFVTALRCKGETVEEIAGLAHTMRSKALHVIITVPVLDTCGTGGDVMVRLISPLPPPSSRLPAVLKLPSMATAP